MENGRDVEDELLLRCAATGRGQVTVARDQREANIFRLAAVVIQSRFPLEAEGIVHASERYFARHPEDMVPSPEVMRKCWVSSMPRLQDMLSRKLGWSWNVGELSPNLESSRRGSAGSPPA